MTKPNFSTFNDNVALPVTHMTKPKFSMFNDNVALPVTTNTGCGGTDADAGAAHGLTNVS